MISILRCIYRYKYTDDPWTTQVWTVWAHSYVGVFSTCGTGFDPRLGGRRRREPTACVVCAISLRELGVCRFWCLGGPGTDTRHGYWGTSTFWGSQKSYMDFFTMWGLALQTPLLFKGQLRVCCFLKTYYGCQTYFSSSQNSVMNLHVPNSLPMCPLILPMFPGFEANPKKLIIIIFSFILFIPGGGEGRERDIDQLPHECALTGHGTHNPRLCRDQESSPRLSFAGRRPTHWATLAGAHGTLSYPWIPDTYLQKIRLLSKHRHVFKTIHSLLI